MDELFGTLCHVNKYSKWGNGRDVGDSEIIQKLRKFYTFDQDRAPGDPVVMNIKSPAQSIIVINKQTIIQKRCITEQ